MVHTRFPSCHFIALEGGETLLQTLELTRGTCGTYRGAEILYSLAVSHARHVGMEGRYPVSDYTLLTDARRNIALFQHHDAITGTAKEIVVIDYGSRYVSGTPVDDSAPRFLNPSSCGML